MKTEKELHQEFLKLGANRRKLTNELLALLPEIYDRKIYLKYASTIVEYAGKFGGLSKGVVLKRLRLEKYLSDKPKLKEAIKTEGVHKVALVASVATTETEEAWVDKLKNMSKNAIQELSKEMRNKEIEAKNKDFGGGSLFGCLDEARGVTAKELGSGGEQMASASAPCKAAPLKITIELADETAFLFLKIKKKFGKNLSNKEVMNEILKRLADTEFSEKVILEDNFREENKTEISKSVPVERNERQKNDHERIEKSQQKITPKISRYIPVHVKKMATASTHDKCAYPNCGHPAEILHHRDRFAESKNHQSIIPLCKTHHEFAHNGIIANESQNAEQWNLKIAQVGLAKPDILYREIRQENLK